MFVVNCVHANKMNIKHIVIFGDSLTSNGRYLVNFWKNFFATDLNPRPKFTNGPAWAAILGQHYQDVENIDYHIYAFPAATVNFHLVDAHFFPALFKIEVYHYLFKTMFENRDDTLFIIWVGTYDYILDFQKQKNMELSTDHIIAGVVHAIKKLMHDGGRNFIVMNLPDPTRSPIFISVGSPDKLKQSIELHNKKLAAAIKIIQSSNDVNIFLFDTNSLYNFILNNPEKYKLKNITDACLKKCKNPDEYFYWDDLHPSRVVHKLLSDKIINLIDHSFRLS